MSTETRQRLSRPARRAQLLDAAQEVFVASGYHAAGMDEIAERAGVSKPVLYRHFPGKLDLYVALVEHHAQELVRQVRAALASTTDNRQRVEASVRAYFDFADGEATGTPGAYRLVFESDLRNDPRVAERVQRAQDECVAAVAEVIAADTGLGPDEAALLSSGLAGLAELGSRWWLDAGRTLDKDVATELLARLAWRGVSGAPVVARDGSPG